MTKCERVRQHFETATAGELEPELACHVHDCQSCREELVHATQFREGGAMLKNVRAPAELKARLKTMARLPHECEQALAMLSLALDGELEATRRHELLGHMHSCRACQAAWEAMATLREVGSLTTLAEPARSTLAVHPRYRIATRRRRQLFDLRLATAAAYLLAALTVFLLGNPAEVARASSAPVARAALYTRAAVENRLESFARRVHEGASAAYARAEELARDAWHTVRSVFGRTHENRKPSGNVVPDGNGGRL